MRRIQNLLGMAQRANRIASGNLAVEQALKNGTAKYLLIAEDAEEASRKAYTEMAERYRVPCKTALEREALGACLGKPCRAAAAILDDGFRKALERLLEGTEAR